MRAVACTAAIPERRLASLGRVIRAEMERWSRKRRLRGARAFSISIGVHYGPVVVGNLGGERRVEFTAVGDVVNVASRLEQVTRELGCQLVISDDCVEAARRVVFLGPFDRVEDIPLRGRTANLRVHLAGCSSCPD